MTKQRLAGTAPAVAAAALIAGGAVAQNQERTMETSVPANGCRSAHPGGIAGDGIGTLKLNVPAIGISTNSLEGL